MNIRDELSAAMRHARPQFLESACVDLDVVPSALTAFLTGGELPLKQVELLLTYFSFKLMRGNDGK